MKSFAKVKQVYNLRSFAPLYQKISKNFLFIFKNSIIVWNISLKIKTFEFNIYNYFYIQTLFLRTFKAIINLKLCSKIFLMNYKLV